ncbi:hypothetical protein KTQ54_06290 [Komagataeibacter oboediens]|uniref:hypothetical protein n=1 Tax=Komagataeibacter oboediens TaxID=65958 RepID=UPI001C2C5443|nr:hypothetical protein [Komagataeibacter oboediens]MBV0888147.1 hypothetical protein [Komagataeibacter oboediens]MCK9820752.1 hypothetical protein [Komagataeibacter oboediens]
MTDTSTTSTATAATAATQNYILYRTAARMYQPGYGYNAGDTPVVPAAQVSTAAGTVIATQQLTGLTGVTAPAGFAYALDADGKYPVGSIYTPPAATS